MRRGATMTLTVTTVAFLLVGCGGTASTPGPATVTVQVPAPAVTEIAPEAPVIVTLPDVVGQNGAIVEDTLRGLGLTKVELAADPKSGRELVINPANWTVTKIEPEAGTEVRTDQTVVLTMTK